MSRKTINIYLSKEDKRKIDALKVKYQLSLTTIIDILADVTNDTLKLENNEDLIYRIQNISMYQAENKTSVKEPKCFGRLEIENKNKYANNILHIYLNNEIGKLITHSDLITGKYGYWNRINKEMQTRKDNWWQYNETLRLQRRILRENKEYFKKALETV